MKFDCIPALKALSDEARLRIIRRLLERNHNVGELAEALGIAQSNVSKHLRVLREAGLVEVEKRAQCRNYRLARDFRTHLDSNSHQLDLGCCRFDFDKLLPGRSR